MRRSILFGLRVKSYRRNQKTCSKTLDFLFECSRGLNCMNYNDFDDLLRLKNQGSIKKNGFEHLAHVDKL